MNDKSKTPRRRHSGVRKMFLMLVGMVTFLVSIMVAVPSGTTVRDPSVRPPQAADLALMREVSDWLLGGEEANQFRAVTASDLAAALRDEPESFVLFGRPRRRGAERQLVRGLPYGKLIWDSAQRNQIDGLLLASIVETESSFNAHAVSPQGAIGLTQVLPSTAQLFGIQDAAAPAQNIEAGARYFSELMSRFNQDVVLALAAYNAGPESVRRFEGMPPYRETRHYVDRVLSRYVAHYQQLWQRNDPPRTNG
jgi:soluble lytic murein transglycosylase-like protein